MDIGDIWEMRINQFMTGGFQNRHVFVVNANIPTWHQDVYDQWLAACQTLFVSRRSSSWSIESIVFSQVWPGTEADVEIDVQDPDNGTGFGVQWPQMNAAKIIWRTGFAGKSFRGCSFFAGYRQVDAVDSSISNSLFLVLESYCTAMLATFGLAGSFQGVAQFGVLSRQHDLVELDPPVLTVATGFTVQDTIRNVRRRRNA